MKELLFYNIHQIAEKIRTREISPVDLVENLFDRIDKLDHAINAYVTIHRCQVLKDAKEIEIEINNGNYKGPLHGIPIGVKDNIFTKGIRTTMGSEIFKDFLPDENASVIDSLKDAGAIIIGKLNTHQFAYGPTGDRSYAGPTRNPYDTDKMTGGSSSGSAAAVAAFLCFGSLGTDTGGSVRVPASFCGIVGMKPTKGNVSNHGVYPLSWTLDHVGPMTRSVKDNALLLNVIVARNEPKSIHHQAEDFTRLIGKEIKGKRIGIPRVFYFEGIQKEITAAIQETIKVFEMLGAEIREVDLLHMDRIIHAQRTILRTEAYAIHRENLEDYPEMWDEEVKERLLTGLVPRGFEYAQALLDRDFAKQEFNRILQDCDVILTPTMPIMPPDINNRYTTDSGQEEDHIRWTITKLTSPTNLNGLPSLTLPSGYSKEGMPIGVQLIGKEFDEAVLYQLGYALEQEITPKVKKGQLSLKNLLESKIK